MSFPQIKEHLKKLVSNKLHTKVDSFDMVSVGGGSINDTYRLTINKSSKFFLKLNSLTKFPGLFEKEKKGLEFLGLQNRILTPAVIFFETINDRQSLLLEWVEPGSRDKNFWKKFGEQLAQLHSISHEHFGFTENNYMGSLPQANNFTDGWTAFFINYRLQPQIELATAKNLLQKSHLFSFESLFKKIDSIFNTEKPSLLHGDLWSGNFMCNEKSLPVLIDPAVYFGHRGMDLAMTTLFGGFDSAFYDSYQYHSPFPAHYKEQWEICNLYPLLIHLNLFGSSYLYQVERTLQKLS
jgi:protein-ribulosamine 3-kinase